MKQPNKKKSLINRSSTRESLPNTAKDNTSVNNTLDANKFSKTARNKTDEEYAQERREKIKSSVEAQKTPYTKDNWRNVLSEVTKATGDKLRVSDYPNAFDDYLNPIAGIGHMASTLGGAPKRAKDEDSVMPYVTAAAMPLAAGAMAGIGTKTTGQFINNVVNPVAGAENIVNKAFKTSLGKKALRRIVDMPNPDLAEKLTKEELKAFRQVNEVGAMRATAKPYSQQMQKALDGGLSEVHTERMFGQNLDALRESAQIQKAREFSDAVDYTVGTPRQTIDLTRPPGSTGRRDMNLQNIRDQLAAEGQDWDVLSGMQPSVSEARNLTLKEQAKIASADAVRGANIKSGRRIENGLVALEEGIENKVNSVSRSWEDFTDVMNSPPKEAVSKMVKGTKKAIKKKLTPMAYNNLQTTPYNNGIRTENIHMATMAQSGTKRNFAKQVEEQALKNTKSGDLVTGSTNLSHNSYMNQISQVFKSKDGAPQFLGYEGMNSLGYLSSYNYPHKDILKFLNSEIDDKIRKGVVAKDIFRPYIKDGQIKLPQYGIKKFKYGGRINNINTNTMKYPMKKPVKKGMWGTAIMGGVGLVSSIMGSNAADKAQKRAADLAQRNNLNMAVQEQDVYADEFKRNNVGDLPVYAKGGSMDGSSTSSTTGKLDATGGDLIPISDNAEVVQGNSHDENAIDGSYGVTLANGNEPVANVEDKEVVVGNDLVFSDKLMKGGRSFASIALEVNTKIGDLQANLKSSVKPAEKFSIERTIKGLEKANEELFKEQEMVKQQEVGEGQEMVDVEQGSVPMAESGIRLNRNPSILSKYRKANGLDGANAGDEDSAIGIRENSTFEDLAPLAIDNIANLLITANAPSPTAPIAKRAPIMDTRINANPQLAGVNSAVAASNETIRGNTNNSGVARANITAANLKGAQMKSGIYSEKQNQERALMNQQKAMQSQVANQNADGLDEYAQDVYQNTLEKNASYSANVSNIVEDYTAVKQAELEKDNNDTLITMGLLDDPTGEKARVYARTGRTLNESSVKLAAAERARMKKMKADKARAFFNNKINTVQ